MLIRLVEPKLLPKTSPESINFFETDQFCLKPGSLLTFNEACVSSANNPEQVADGLRGDFLDGLNFNRICEDTYLEVKMRKEMLGIDEMVKTQNRSFA